MALVSADCAGDRGGHPLARWQAAMVPAFVPVPPVAGIPSRRRGEWSVCQEPLLRRRHVPSRSQPIVKKAQTSGRESALPIRLARHPAVRRYQEAVGGKFFDMGNARGSTGSPRPDPVLPKPPVPALPTTAIADGISTPPGAWRAGCLYLTSWREVSFSDRRRR